MFLYDIIDRKIEWLNLYSANKILKYFIEFYEIYFIL